MERRRRGNERQLGRKVSTLNVVIREELANKVTQRKKPEGRAGYEAVQEKVPAGRKGRRTASEDGRAGGRSEQQEEGRCE